MCCRCGPRTVASSPVGGIPKRRSDLCRLAGLAPVAAIGELVCDDGAMMRLPQVLALAGQHQLPVLTIAQLRRVAGGP